MTPAQLSTLKSVALADPVAAGYLNAGNDTGLSEWFNQQTTHIVWRSVLTPELARAAIIKGATQLDALTVGKRDSLFYLVSGNLDASDAAVRASLDDLCGSQNTLKGFVRAACKRQASRAEKALATGTGTDAVPATLGYEGVISGNDASLIREAA